jgi:hypothetical protein
MAFEHDLDIVCASCGKSFRLPPVWQRLFVERAGRLPDRCARCSEERATTKRR